MCIENHMTGRLDVSLWTLDAHVVYFHSSFPFVVLSQTEQKPLTYRTLKYVSINILSRLTNPWYLVDLLSLYNSTSSFYKQVKCFSKYSKNLKRKDKTYVPKISGLKHTRFAYVQYRQ